MNLWRESLKARLEPFAQLALHTDYICHDDHDDCDDCDDCDDRDGDDGHDNDRHTIMSLIMSLIISAQRKLESQEDYHFNGQGREGEIARHHFQGL